MEKPIYLDYNATTPVDPHVLEVMLPYFQSEFGNPSSSSHCYGWDADMAIKEARKKVAQLIHCKTSEVVWTSGATESNNLAIEGVIFPILQKGEETPHIITSNIEHKAVLDVCKCLEHRGAEVTYLEVDNMGMISPDAVKNAIQPNTKLISIMTANNEIGTINPINEIAKVAKDHGVLFHTDAAQGLGKIKFDLENTPIDMLSASGHKMYGPKGVGFLFVRNGVKLEPLFCGGSQEKGLRPGTLNVPGIVAMGEACSMADTNFESEVTHLTQLRDNFIKDLLDSCPCARLNGHPTQRIYSNVSISFDGLSSDIFALGLSGLAVSSSSACSSGQAQPSYVLKALGHNDKLAKATIRFGIGRFTTENDLKVALNKVRAMIQKNTEITKV